MSALDQADRHLRARRGVRLGRESLYLPALLKPAAQDLRGLLWAIHAGRPVPSAAEGRVTLRDTSVARDGLEAMGYRALGVVAVRVDMLERFMAQARALARGRPAETSPFAVLRRAATPNRLKPSTKGVSLCKAVSACLRPKGAERGYRSWESAESPRS